MTERTDTSGIPTVNVMLVSAHDWFASALQAVLEPEGFVFARVRSARVALRDAAQIDPDLVILDEGLPDMDVPGVAASLVRGPLKASVPILAYSPNFWHEAAQAATMRAGAWDIIKEPVRSNLIVAKLRRLLEIKHLIEIAEEGSLSDTATGLFNLAGMTRMLRVMGAAARRHGSALSCLVLGPTEEPSPASVDLIRASAAALCSGGVRESDICGWIGEVDLGVVAFGADAAGVTMLARRLADRAAADPATENLTPLSAGIVQLTPHAEGTDAKSAPMAPMASRIASLSGVAAARNALREAREAGGGIRIAKSPRP